MIGTCKKLLLVTGQNITDFLVNNIWNNRYLRAERVYSPTTVFYILRGYDFSLVFPDVYVKKRVFDGFKLI